MIVAATESRDAYFARFALQPFHRVGMILTYRVLDLVIVDVMLS